MKKVRQVLNSHWVTGFAVIAAFLLLWELIASIVSSRNLPTMSQTIVWIIADFGLLALCTVATVTRAILGLLAAAVTGATIAIAMSMHRTVDRLLTPLADFLRPLPSSALILPFLLQP